MSHSIFNIKNLPMDMARIVCAVLIPIFRLKKITPTGEKYKQKIKGGAIVAANHASFADPFTVGLTFWYRRMHFLVAEVVMKGKLRNLLLRGIGAIKIDRNCTDIEAISKSINKLKQGYILTVFPQGGIDRTDNIDSVKSGAILMALRSNSPIIPMHILPKNKWHERKKVVIGKTLYPADFFKTKFPSTNDINNMTQALVEELNICKQAEH